MKKSSFQFRSGTIQLDMTPCAYSKDMLPAAVTPSANVMGLSMNGIIALLMRGNRVRSVDSDGQSAKIHVLSGLRTGFDCWLMVESVIWEGDRVKGRGAVARKTVCLTKPEEFDERFYLPGCCRDKAFTDLLSSKTQLAGPVRVLDGSAIRVRPPPYEIWLWRVAARQMDGTETVCWVPMHKVDLDDPNDIVFQDDASPSGADTAKHSAGSGPVRIGRGPILKSDGSAGSQLH